MKKSTTMIAIMLMTIVLIVSCGESKTNNNKESDINDDISNSDNDEQTDAENGDTGNTGDTGNSGTQGEMVSVPAGSFQMGCNEAVDDKCQSDESPYHAVTLSAYKIDKYEVTVGEYQKCVDSGDCNNDNGDEPHYWTATDSIYSYCNLGATGKGDHPMNCVSWFGAKAYCEWKGLRLPTEAEWEKAARGTDGRKYPWGNSPAVSCDHAVMDDYSSAGGDGCGTDSTWVVGSKEKGKSPYGAYDMIGNVWEWVNDWYGSDYYETTPSENPAGPESGDSRVLRGGSWSYDDDGYNHLRASYRSNGTPDYRLNSRGFRCAK